MNTATYVLHPKAFEADDQMDAIRYAFASLPSYEATPWIPGEWDSETPAEALCEAAREICRREDEAHGRG